MLLDFDLGQSDGAQFMRSAGEHGYRGKVLVVTAGVGKDEAADLIRSGVSGIFTKSNSAALLADGIRDVMAGKVWFDQELLQEAMGRAESRSENQAGLFTERERLVLSCVFEGLANKEIAERISASESSVKATLQQLFSKTGVRTRSQLVRVALEQYKDEVQ
jgi:two-component system nitrate/nitrite response regulator NarL